jgi:hypothetical protein
MSFTQYVRYLVVAMTLVYLVCVGAFSVLKLTTSFPPIPWAEVFYGPLIAVGSCLLLVLGAVWVERVIRGPSGKPANRDAD